MFRSVRLFARLAVANAMIGTAIDEQKHEESINQQGPLGIAKLGKIRQSPNTERQSRGQHDTQPNTIGALHSKYLERGLPGVLNSRGKTGRHLIRSPLEDDSLSAQRNFIQR